MNTTAGRGSDFLPLVKSEPRDGMVAENRAQRGAEVDAVGRKTLIAFYIFSSQRQKLVDHRTIRLS